MPRLNPERTNELKAQQANAEYIRKHFPLNVQVNDGWAVDTVDQVYTSKVYGHGTVSTDMYPPFKTTFNPR